MYYLKNVWKVALLGALGGLVFEGFVWAYDELIGYGYRILSHYKFAETLAIMMAVGIFWAVILYLSWFILKDEVPRLLATLSLKAKEKRMVRLKELHTAGLYTDEEFNTQLAELKR